MSTPPAENPVPTPDRAESPSPVPLGASAAAIPTLLREVRRRGEVRLTDVCAVVDDRGIPWKWFRYEHVDFLKILIRRGFAGRIRLLGTGTYVNEWWSSTDQGNFEGKERHEVHLDVILRLCAKPAYSLIEDRSRGIPELAFVSILGSKLARILEAIVKESTEAPRRREAKRVRKPEEVPSNIWAETRERLLEHRRARDSWWRDG